MSSLKVQITSPEIKAVLAYFPSLLQTCIKQLLFISNYDKNLHYTLDFSSSSNTGFLGRGGGEGIKVLSAGITGSNITIPESRRQPTWTCSAVPPCRASCYSHAAVKVNKLPICALILAHCSTTQYSIKITEHASQTKDTFFDKGQNPSNCVAMSILLL